MAATAEPDVPGLLCTTADARDPEVATAVQAGRAHDTAGDTCSIAAHAPPRRRRRASVSKTKICIAACFLLIFLSMAIVGIVMLAIPDGDASEGGVLLGIGLGVLACCCCLAVCFFTLVEAFFLFFFFA